MGKKIKTEREQQLQLLQQKEAVINNLLSFSKKRFKRFDEVIDQLYEGENLSTYFTDKRIWKISDCFGKVSPKTKGAERIVLKDVLKYLYKCSLLVSSEDYIQVVWNIVQCRNNWLKNILKWVPVSRDANTQVKELATYLFCKYPVPDFLYKTLYETRNTQHVNWLVHLGNGGRVKDLKQIPIPFTQKMGHYFLQANPEFTIIEALRWAQVKGLNGQDKLAEKIAYSWMGSKPYEHEVFWESFLQLLVNGGMFNLEKVTELIDFVREEKRANVAYVLKGRTLSSLMRQSDKWHNKFGHFKENQAWNSCGISGFELARKNEQIVLHQLTESKWLAQEGKTMKHCVGSYAFYCAKGKSAIFSVRKYADGVLLDTLATIEVNIALQRIVQAKAKMNKMISDEARKVMELWAAKELLAISPHL